MAAAILGPSTFLRQTVELTRPPAERSLHPADLSSSAAPPAPPLDPLYRPLTPAAGRCKLDKRDDWWWVVGGSVCVSGYLLTGDLKLD